MSDLAVQTETSVGDWIKQAIENNRGADELSKLLDVFERMQKVKAEVAFNTSMVACESELPAILEDARNPQTQSTYASLDQIQHLAKPIIHKHGFSLSFAEDECPLDGWKRNICDVRHVGGHCVRYKLDLPLDGVGAKGNPIGSMNPVQAAVSTGSYGQRVLFCRIFNLTIAGTDRDGQSTAKISSEQVAELNTLIMRVRDSGKKVDTKKVLAYISEVEGVLITSLSEVTVKAFPKLVAMLESQVGK